MSILQCENGHLGTTLFYSLAGREGKDALIVEQLDVVMATEIKVTLIA